MGIELPSRMMRLRTETLGSLYFRQHLPASVPRENNYLGVRAQVIGTYLRRSVVHEAHA
jgi:hypothetical protein